MTSFPVTLLLDVINNVSNVHRVLAEFRPRQRYCQCARMHCCVAIFLIFSSFVAGNKPCELVGKTLNMRGSAGVSTWWQCSVWDVSRVRGTHTLECAHVETLSTCTGLSSGVQTTAFVVNRYTVRLQINQNPMSSFNNYSLQSFVIFSVSNCFDKLLRTVVLFEVDLQIINCFAMR